MMIDYYSTSDYMEIVKMMDESAEAAEHDKRRPRATKYDTTAFYNFRNKKKGKKKR